MQRNRQTTSSLGSPVSLYADQRSKAPSIRSEPSQPRTGKALYQRLEDDENGSQAEVQAGQSRVAGAKMPRRAKIARQASSSLRDPTRQSSSTALLQTAPAPNLALVARQTQLTTRYFSPRSSPPSSQDELRNTLHSVTKLDAREDGRSAVAHEVGIALHHFERGADVGS